MYDDPAGSRECGRIEQGRVTGVWEAKATNETLTWFKAMQLKRQIAILHADRSRAGRTPNSQDRSFVGRFGFSWSDATPSNNADVAPFVTPAFLTPFEKEQRKLGPHHSKNKGNSDQL